MVDTAPKMLECDAFPLFYVIVDEMYFGFGHNK